MSKENCIFRNIDGRRKLYAYVFLSSILIITGIGLMTIWQPQILNVTINKILGSVIIIGALSALLHTLSFNDKDKANDVLIYIVAISCSLMSIFLVGEIWFDIFEGSTLSKITKSLLIIAIVTGLISAIKYDFFENKKLKDENYLD